MGLELAATHGPKPWILPTTALWLSNDLLLKIKHMMKVHALDLPLWRRIESGLMMAAE